MDFFQYKNLRAFAMEPMAEHFSTSAAVRAREVVGEIFGPIGLIQHERDRAIDFWGCIDLSPQQQAAAHLLAVISNHWAIAWWRDADTPDGSEPLPALEPEQKAQLCNETLQAAQQYAAFLPERQAAALLALVPESQTATPAPVTGSASNAPTKKWTPERLAEARAYREKHGTKKTAEHFGVSTSLIRQRLPSEQPKPKGYSAFTHRSK